MAFWSTQRIEAAQPFINLINPFDSERVKQGSYELSLSREAITTSDPERTNDFELPDVLEIPPGQFAILYTYEKVKIPDDTLALISVKASVKYEGLVNISGFHVDPGFEGRLKFSVYNAGTRPIFLEYLKPTFLIWFAEFDERVRNPYDGNHKNQERITPRDRERMAHETHSPSALKERLDAVETRVRWLISGLVAFVTLVTIPLAIGIVVALLQVWLEHGPEGETPASKPINQQRSEQTQ